MNKEKKRPTLEELREYPGLWPFELAYIVREAKDAGLEEIKQETLDMWFYDPELTPEKIVELREKLQRATGSTEVEPQREVA